MVCISAWLGRHVESDVSEESQSRHGSVYEQIGTTFLHDLSNLLHLVPIEAFASAVELLVEARRRHRRVYVIGNGGSAATASHLVCDLVKATRAPGKEPMRVFALADNASVLTAWANDTSYDRVFAEQLVGCLDCGDLVVAISASGRSPNVIAALHVARSAGVRTIGLLGFSGGEALELVDVPIHIGCHDYGLVETIHLGIVHAFAAALMTASPGHLLPDGESLSGTSYSPSAAADHRHARVIE
jgi:D-sedoheptulose 7-phosphate isomerase